MSQENIFNEASAMAKVGGTGKRASYKGVLSIFNTALEIDAEYHIKAAKAETDQYSAPIKKLDKATGREVVGKEVVRFFAYKVGEDGLRQEERELSYDEAKAGLRFNGEFQISGKNVTRYFDKSALENKDNPQWIEVPGDNIVDTQDGQEVEEFTRTERIVIDERTEEGGLVPLSKIPEYKIKDIYMIKPDEKEKVDRVRILARKLLDKQSALLAFFCWRRGFKWYNALIYPVENSDGKLFLVMAMAEGRTVLDEAWQLTGGPSATELAPVVSRPKPKVRLSK